MLTVEFADISASWQVFPLRRIRAWPLPERAHPQWYRVLALREVGAERTQRCGCEVL